MSKPNRTTTAAAKAKPSATPRRRPAAKVAMQAAPVQPVCVAPSIETPREAAGPAVDRLGVSPRRMRLTVGGRVYRVTLGPLPGMLGLVNHPQQTITLSSDHGREHLAGTLALQHAQAVALVYPPPVNVMGEAFARWVAALSLDFGRQFSEQGGERALWRMLGTATGDRGALAFNVAGVVYPVRIICHKLQADDGRDVVGLTTYRQCIDLHVSLPAFQRARVLRHELWHAWVMELHVPETEEQIADLHAKVSEHYDADLQAQGGLAALEALEPDDVMGV
jgi:hypothetical protein